jgi:hypothetical protein
MTLMAQDASMGIFSIEVTVLQTKATFDAGGYIDANFITGWHPGHSAIRRITLGLFSLILSHYTSLYTPLNGGSPFPAKKNCMAASLPFPNLSL